MPAEERRGRQQSIAGKANTPAEREEAPTTRSARRTRWHTARWMEVAHQTTPQTAQTPADEKGGGEGGDGDKERLNRLREWLAPLATTKERARYTGIGTRKARGRGRTRQRAQVPRVMPVPGGARTASPRRILHPLRRGKWNTRRQERRTGTRLPRMERSPSPPVLAPRYGAPHAPVADREKRSRPRRRPAYPHRAGRASTIPQSGKVLGGIGEEWEGGEVTQTNKRKKEWREECSKGKKEGRKEVGTARKWKVRKKKKKRRQHDYQHRRPRRRGP
ncbi:hypothetical protein DFH09DRAFT_1079061 [Mycena vulgaris]|nr:hypothetical protein DFH09DRAFT_1079061 [Mycena vulgaris]